MTIIASIVSDDSVSVCVDGNMRAIGSAHPNYVEIREALAANDLGLAESLLDVAAAVENFGEGSVTIEGGVVKYLGTVIDNSVTRRLLSMMREGFDVNPMLLFLKNLQENPSFRAVNELYGFLEATDLPITADGKFVAYKMVRDNYTDLHSGKFQNGIGANPSMPRNEVDEDPTNTCSRGLHVCSQAYLGFYSQGPRTMVVAVNPRDVVAVPEDYNNSKMRVCAYTVIAELTDEQITAKGEREDHSFDTPVLELQDKDVVEELLTLADAAEELCGHADKPMAALRKRISRGSVETRDVDGVTHVVVKR